MQNNADTPDTAASDALASLNFDQAELDKFSALAARWWDPESEFKPLHAINPLRLGWIRDLAGPLAGKKILDVGCGGGILAESMAKEEAEVTGIDLADKPLTVARLHGLESGVKVNYRKISAEDHAREQPGHYDIVTCMEMLEHVPTPPSIVQACAQLVKPGGWVFFSTLNRNPKSFLFAIVAAEYILNMLPRGTHSYENFIRPSELAAAIRQSGLTVKTMTGLTYNPLTQHYSLTDDTSVNYLVATQRAQ
ncbi:MAG TPA: bifunctional 2-polyprenyl-6-hydroxyphenol methylase/3-demethylubiquinol 3-O-methyltransferase UbiG [Burkholderiaceae bacterium]|nr:bifunctional 2-polyprenyl-6-hydroxyphenol methylase/3-demethylubiquinol 3-O-methyltransferase UbiG [Burkholderiaceae bacterium]